ncbi:MAG: PTS transporter subunit EIIC, partial [Longicatena sp.]
AIIATLLIHLFWFFGVHDAALAGILGPVRDGGLSLNAAAQAAGKALPNVFTTPFWVYFVVIGGCGACLALAILLVRSKSKQLKTVGRVGIVPAFFNISEPIIFGVPLMLNPIFLIPFLFTSTLNAVIAYACMDSGLIGRSFAMLSWNMPSVFGAFLSTMDWRAVVLVVLLILMDILIYYPFFKIQERQLVALENEEEEVKEIE